MPESENTIQQKIRLAVGSTKARLFRNQTGLYKLADGRVVRSGLCVGSSDLIGFNPITITPDMVGQKLAVFTAIEVKRPGKKPSTKQSNFLDAVNNAGGIAGVATSTESALELLYPEK